MKRRRLFGCVVIPVGYAITVMIVSAAISRSADDFAITTALFTLLGWVVMFVGFWIFAGLKLGEKVGTSAKTWAENERAKRDERQP